MKGTDPDLRDLPDVLHWLTLDAKARILEHSETRLADVRDKIFPHGPERLPPKEPRKPEKAAERVHVSPPLRRLFERGGPDEELELVVTLRADGRVPPLPPLGREEDRNGETRRTAVVRKLAAERAASQAKRLAGLPFKARAHFWIVDAVCGTARLKDIGSILACPEVVYVQPRFGGKPPSPDASTLNDVDDARDQLVCDPYRPLEIDELQWIGLFDSGVRRTHRLLTMPDRIDWWRDTVRGGQSGRDSAAPGFNPDDLIDHGTASAAILSGTDSLGTAYRGLTRVKVDSWRVYDSVTGLVDLQAVLWGIEAGLAGFEEYLVLLVQFEEDEWGALARAADAAFDAGAIVVAANGNVANPDERSVLSPAVAHKVIGVGAYDVVSRLRTVNQARGPTSDGRIKPDIQAPTNTETASSASDTALMIHQGTSGATPYAGGVAILCHRWLRGGRWRDKGLVYAYLILYGRRTYPFDNADGAGPMRMLVNAGVGHGRFIVHDGQWVEIPVDLPAHRRDFDAAIWWPEDVDDEHSDVDLFILDPAGAIRSYSNSDRSVFQRAGVAGPLEPGRWRVLLNGFDVPRGTQDVFLAMTARFT